MVVRVDPSNHWRFVTGRTTIQYFQRTGEGTFYGGVNGVQVKNAKMTSPSKSMIEADAFLAHHGAVWTVWANQFPKQYTIIPKVGDRIRDKSGKAYEVKSLEFLILSDVYIKFIMTCYKEPDT